MWRRAIQRNLNNSLPYDERPLSVADADIRKWTNEALCHSTDWNRMAPHSVIRRHLVRDTYLRLRNACDIEKLSSKYTSSDRMSSVHSFIRSQVSTCKCLFLALLHFSYIRTYCRSIYERETFLLTCVLSHLAYNCDNALHHAKGLFVLASPGGQSFISPRIIATFRDMTTVRSIYKRYLSHKLFTSAVITHWNPFRPPSSQLNPVLDGNQGQ